MLLPNCVAKNNYLYIYSKFNNLVERLEVYNKDIEVNNKDQLQLSSEFIEWLICFTDAEGCFHVAFQISGNAYEFRFSFCLHIYKHLVLDFIQSKLGLDKVKMDFYRAMTLYNIISKKEIGIIIALFTKHNLNTTKHPNFRVFKKLLIFNNPNRYIKVLKPWPSRFFYRTSAKRS